eukprot:7518855-Pyramimonas_sp.AAC.1
MSSRAMIPKWYAMHCGARRGMALKSTAKRSINLALHCTPRHGTGNGVNAAAGARVGTSGSAGMRPTLQRERDSERAEARK